jgi:nitrite reductase (NO-forming)
MPAAASRASGRGVDRRLTVAGIGVAALYLLAAGLSVGLTESDRRGLWLPLHLAFLGGGGTAIVAVLPYFAASLSAVPAPSPVLRGAAIVLVAIGAAAATGGVVTAAAGVAVWGGVLVLAGVGTTAAILVRTVRSAPSGRSSDRARVARLATLAGLGALAAVELGGLLAVLFLAGSGWATATWPTARIAHAWLNVFGFVGLVVTSTLVHLLPTVLGTRVVLRATGPGAVALLGLAAIGGAAGFLVGSDPLVRIAAVGLLGSAVALVVEAARVWRARGRWTTDAGWHRFVVGSLLASVAWFAVVLAAVAARTLGAGASPSAWGLRPLLAPLGAGWLASAFLGSASHLVPSIGPGDPERHAAVRRLLGRAAMARLLGLHGGVLLLGLASISADAGAPAGSARALEVLGALGLAGVLVAAAASLVLLGRGLVVLLRAA